MMQGSQFFREIGENCWDVWRCANGNMQRFETQVQVVCTIPVMFNYDAPLAHAQDIAGFLNDHISALVANDPEALRGPVHRAHGRHRRPSVN